MPPYRGRFRPLEVSTRTQSSADYIITMFGFDLRQGQGLAGSPAPGGCSPQTGSAAINGGPEASPYGNIRWRTAAAGGHIRQVFAPRVRPPRDRKNAGLPWHIALRRRA